METSRSAYKMWKNGSPGSQYFLVENRRKQGFDALMPNEGLLVYHDDASQSGNTNDLRRLVDLESANADTANKDHLDVQGGSGTEANDFWPGYLGKTAFDPFSDADSRNYDTPYLTMVAAYNIRAGSSDTMLLDLFVGGSQLTTTAHHVNDAGGNNNGIPEEGETVGLTVTLANAAGWSNATGVTATLSTADTSVIITKASASFPGINNGSSASCAADSFAFYVKPAVFPHKVAFLVTKSSSPGSYDAVDTLSIAVGIPRVLLVDDDAGSAYEGFYRGALDSVSALYREWTVSSSGSPSLAKLDSFPVVIWFTGDDSLGTMTSSDTANVKSYLDGGGKMFISSKQLGQQLGTTGFYANYLRAQYVNNNANQRLLRGVPGNPIGNSASDTIALGYTGGSANYQSMDIVNAINGADSCFVYRTIGGAGGVTYEGGYKLVYLAFPFEALSGPSRYVQRVVMLERILNWFGGVLPTGVESNGQSPSAARPELRLQAAPTPFGARTSLSFKLERECRARLSVYNGLGQRVAGLHSGTLRAGNHRFTWDGRDLTGRTASSGIYFAKLETEDGGRATARLIKLR